MDNLQHYINELEDLKKEADEITGRWSGKESGLIEEKAILANDISEKASEIIELLKELK